MWSWLNQNEVLWQNNFIQVSVRKVQIQLILGRTADEKGLNSNRFYKQESQQFPGLIACIVYLLTWELASSADCTATGYNNSNLHHSVFRLSKVTFFVAFDVTNTCKERLF